MTFAAAAIGIASNVFQTVVAVRSAEMQERIAKNNAIQASLNATAEERRLRRQQSRQMGAARAFFGASGTTLQGSPLDILADQAMEAEENALLVRFGGERQRIAFETQAAFKKSEARAALYGGLLKTGASGVSGAAQAGAFS